MPGMSKSWSGSGKRRHRAEAAAARRRAGRPDANDTIARIAAEQRALDARIAAQRIADEARAAALMRSQTAADRAAAAERRGRWPLGDARQQVRDGYSVTVVARRTGWPVEMLNDVIPGRW
jgi:hypothetical protein